MPLAASGPAKVASGPLKPEVATGVTTVGGSRSAAVARLAVANVRIAAAAIARRALILGARAPSRCRSVIRLTP